MNEATTAMNHGFKRALEEDAQAVEAMLTTLLANSVLEGENCRPERLLAAMRHGALNGGKRLRPFLLLETARLFGADGPGTLRAAAALECVHCYSLIHDDLPAMDDDDMRRGQPTVHKAFDDATAILAGDSLLTYAFDILADPQTHPDPAIRADLVLHLARAAGIGGMAGGQMLDIAAETAENPLDEQAIRTLQAMKTGALIRYACEAGAIIGMADDAKRQTLIRFGKTIGLAFQLADDLLDVTASSEQLGKATAKDAGMGKATLVSLHGVDATQIMLGKLVDEAKALLAPFGTRAHVLKATADYIAERSH